MDTQSEYNQLSCRRWKNFLLGAGKKEMIIKQMNTTWNEYFNMSGYRIHTFKIESKNNNTESNLMTKKSLGFDFSSSSQFLDQADPNIAGVRYLITDL